VTIDVFGAAGGTASSVNLGPGGAGGKGGETKGTLPVTPGEVLQVNVGCAGQNGVNERRRRGDGTTWRRRHVRWA
jgi:hypothetical protein